MQNNTNKQHKDRKHLWSSSLTLKWGDNFWHAKHKQNLWKEHLDAQCAHCLEDHTRAIQQSSSIHTKHFHNIQQQNNNHTQTYCELLQQTIHKHATHKTNKSINRATHKIQGYNITLTTIPVQEAIKHSKNCNSLGPDNLNIRHLKT